MEPEEKYRIPERRRAKSQQFIHFLYNREQGCLGRGCSSWCKIIIFYIILYAVLAGFFAGSLRAFYETIPDNMPKLRIGNGQAILVTPGLSSVPIYQGEKTTRMMVQKLSYSMSNADSYAGYVAQLHEFIEKGGYTNESTVTLEDCDGYTLTESCPLGLNSLSECWDGSDPDFDFGYGEGKPCILIKMNKLYNWIPEPYTTSPDNVGSRFLPGYMPLVCTQFDSQKSSEDVPIGTVSYYPAAGFPTSCFPFCGSSREYQAPLSMIKFQNITKDAMTEIQCKLSAQNVGISWRQGVGSLVFQLEIET